MCGWGEEEDEGELKMQGEKVPRVTEFRYLGSTVQADGDNEIEVSEEDSGRMEQLEKGVGCAV